MHSSNKRYQIKDLKKRFPIEDIIEWDVQNWSELMVYWYPILQQLPKDKKVLAIGERSGGLSLWLALLGFDVLCTDIEDISLRASILHKKYNVTDKISYHVLDVVNETGFTGEFDVIIAKSVLGGVKANRSDPNTRGADTRTKAVKNIHRMLKQDGYFFSAENIAGNQLMRSARKALGKNRSWGYISYTELKEMFSCFNSSEIKTFAILPTLFSSAIVNNIVYRLNKFLMPFTDPSKRIIAFTVAKK